MRSSISTPTLPLALVLPLLYASACHSTSAASSAPGSSAEPQHEPVLTAAPLRSTPATGASEALPSTAPSTPGVAAATAHTPRVHYALAKHLARAELRRGEAQLFDYGVPGDAKYTLGGWLGSASQARELAGSQALVVQSKKVKLALPSDAENARHLVLRLRSFQSTALTMHLNGRALGDKPLSGKELETLQLRLPEGLVRRGENSLELRVHRTGSLPGIPEAGLALDFAELSSSEPSEVLAPPSPAELAPDPSRELLRVPTGVSLGYTLDVPQNAQLRGAVRAGEKGTLVVTAVRDRGAPLRLATLEAGPSPAPFMIDLAAIGGTLARLDLTAQGAAVELAAPSVVTLRNEQPAAERRPIKNVIILLIDTLRADKLEPYNGKTRVKTPGLSRFLGSAGVMLNARTQENWTKPSVATLLSSLFPWQHNAYTDTAKVPDSVELLPELLRKRGYFTGAFIANGYVSDKFGFKQGWHTYRNYIREGRRTIAQAVAADVLDWLDARPKDKPFFLYVHTIDPHVPYKPPQHFLSMYDAAPYAGPVDFSRDNELLEKIKIGRIKLAPRDKVRLEALYDGEISYHDVHFAAIMNGLDKRDLTGETMVVVTADHGEEFWDHGSVGHGHSVYDELLHIPMIVRVPGVTESGQRSSAAVGLVDVAPTILDALGQAIPPEMAGSSFLPELLGDEADAPRVAVAGFMTGWRTLAVGRHKLVQRTLDRMWLYDTQRDPGETNDLAPDEPIALRYARGLLGLALEGRGSSASAKAATVHKQEKTTIDPETEAQLRALGYVGTSDSKGAHPARVR